jgi:hypothetical protein
LADIHDEWAKGRPTIAVKIKTDGFEGQDRGDDEGVWDENEEEGERERRKSENGCKRMVMRSAWENRNAKKNVEFLSLLQLRVVVPRIEMWLLGGPEKDEGGRHPKSGGSW